MIKTKDLKHGYVLNELLVRPTEKAACDTKLGVETEAVSNLAQVFIKEWQLFSPDLRTRKRSIR